ncbi:MAG: deiodinase-like protein [Gammaproteobacteria bacterium]
MAHQLDNPALTDSPSTATMVQTDPLVSIWRIGRQVLAWGFGLLAVLICVAVVKVTAIQADSGFDGYNYSSYREVSPTPGAGLEPGDPFPTEFTVHDLNGNPFPVAVLWRDQPLVLEFGSLSCPIFHSNGPSMEDIYAKYDQGTAKQARVGLLYVREAHPGWFVGRHDDFSDKLNNAQTLQGKGLARPIWVDSLDGGLDGTVGPRANAVYIIDTDGTLIYQSVWNVPSEVDRVLDRLVNRNEMPAWAESNFCDNPVLYYGALDLMAYIGRIALVGGPDALADFIINGILGDRTREDSTECVVAM